MLDTCGRGIVLGRPSGSTPPVSGNLVAHNEAHGGQRAGVAITGLRHAIAAICSRASTRD
jgi:hypothetical protein